MNEEQLKQYGRVVARCWADPDFKARLIADPAATLAGEGVEIPAGVAVRVVEDSAAQRHFVLPSPPEEGELQDEALEQVAGGKGVCCCYITTATLKACGKPEDEAEAILDRFRAFRDHWLRRRPEGEAVIADYYATAPRLVAALDREANAAELYRGLWSGHLTPWLERIEQGDPDTAYRIYLDMVEGLKRRYPQVSSPV